jgi:hypothetical protein
MSQQPANKFPDVFTANIFPQNWVMDLWLPDYVAARFLKQRRDKWGIGRCLRL